MASSALAVVQEEMWRIGDPVELDPGSLPLKSSVFNHYLFKRKQKIAKGEWKSNVSLTEGARAVKIDVETQWEKTGIPHTLEGKQGVEKVKKVILQCQDLIAAVSLKCQRVILVFFWGVWLYVYLEP